MKKWDEGKIYFTRMPNDILMKLARARLAGRDRRVLDVIFRKTFGFGKEMAPISSGYISSLTGIDKRSVVRTLKRLKRWNVIVATMPSQGSGKDAITDSGYVATRGKRKSPIQLIGINTNTAIWGKEAVAVASLPSNKETG
jgi:phage replication O-like protein O